MSPKFTLSASDKALFREMMRDVTPLDQPLTGKTDPRPRTRAAYPNTPVDYNLSDYYAEPVQSESILSYYRSGLAPRQLHAIKAGKMPYEARLDLHGLKPDQAKDRLCDFIHTQIQAQHRLLLIIHGKGGRHGEAPVLKNLIHHWLKQIPDILAFHSAMPKHGGAGALYVLVKRAANLEP